MLPGTYRVIVFALRRDGHPFGGRVWIEEQVDEVVEVALTAVQRQFYRAQAPDLTTALDPKRIIVQANLVAARVPGPSGRTNFRFPEAVGGERHTHASHDFSPHTPVEL